jgi:hypothetical protein
VQGVPAVPGAQLQHIGGIAYTEHGGGVNGGSGRLLPIHARCVVYVIHARCVVYVAWQPGYGCRRAPSAGARRAHDHAQTGVTDESASAASDEDPAACRQDGLRTNWPCTLPTARGR